MSDLTGSAGTLLIFVLILAVLLILLSIHLFLRVRKLERRYRRFMKGKDGLSLEKRFAEEFARLDQISDGQKLLENKIRELRSVAAGNFTKYGVVKYDAFEDMGGRLSFALALLNDEDTGIVINAIHSKDNCFLYLKEIMKGESYIMLSNEEIEALQAAKTKNEAIEEIRQND